MVTNRGNYKLSTRLILKSERKQKSTNSKGTRHNRAALHKFSVCVLVDESQLPAIGVVSTNGQSRRKGDTGGHFAIYFDFCTKGILYYCVAFCTLGSNNACVLDMPRMVALCTRGHFYDSRPLHKRSFS